MKKLIILILICIALCISVFPTSARDVEGGGTIMVGEEHLYLKFLEGNTTKSFGWWEPGYQFKYPNKIIDLSDYTDVSFPESEFAEYIGIWRPVNSSTHEIDTLATTTMAFRLIAPPVTTTSPTPVPTPSEGNIVISSSPSDATVYIDNAIKGITPLTVSVANGDHVVKIRKLGYMDSEKDIVVGGNDVTVGVDLVPITMVPTTIVTTVPTTVPTTTSTTIVISVQTTISATTVEPTNTVTVTETETEEMVALESVESIVTEDNNAKLESMQSQIDAQGAKIEQQNITIQNQEERIDFLASLIDYILSVFGLK